MADTCRRLLIAEERRDTPMVKAVLGAHSAAWRYAVDKGGTLFAQQG